MSKFKGFSNFNVHNNEFHNDALIVQRVILQFLEKHKLKGVRAILDNKQLRFSIANDDFGVESWKID